MLKLTLAAFTALAVPAAAAFQPPRISYESLLKGGDTLRESPFTKALSETGILSVTGIPGMNRREFALSLLRKCAQESKAAREHRFPDGTRRLTMATHTVPGGVQKIDHKVSSQACESFDEASDSFRATVATATKAFANGVAELYGYASSEEQEPLLSTANEIGFKTFSDVVHFGEHLEHFHSYQQMNSLEEKQETIEMHVDQGLFIAFTPGRLMMHNDNVSTQSVVEMTSGFFIELQDGSMEEVKFTNQDDLVFMLGDGVNQYINNKFPANKQLRAVPHALLMDYTRDESYSRVWYGRMVLPPVDALHPAHGTTFGELRDTLIAASLNNREDDTVGVGCSGGMVARDLSATDCGDDATYCWHRCMNHTDFGVSNEVCASRDLAVECINPRQQLWAGEFHGDYYPACADASLLEIETPFPNLEEFPRSEELCTDAEFDAFADADGFEFSAELPGGARFQWSLEGDEVRGRIAYNGLFGWLGFGFANVGGDKNGMHGANVLLALPGGNYTGMSGLDLNLPPEINEYEVHPELTPFRYWMTPLATTPVVTTESVDGDASESIESTECFTAMSFQTSTIGKYTFNLEGTDELIWAANGENAFVQYHGPVSRGRFAIDWPAGQVTVAGTDRSDDEDAPSSSETSAASKICIGVFGVMALLFAPYAL